MKITRKEYITIEIEVADEEHDNADESYKLALSVLNDAEKSFRGTLENAVYYGHLKTAEIVDWESK